MKKPLTVADCVEAQLQFLGLPITGELTERIPDDEPPRFVKAWEPTVGLQCRPVEALFPMDHIPHTNC